MPNVAYFADDHGRILRVVFHGETDRLEIHLSYTTAKGKKEWVPLPQVDTASALRVADSSIEAFAYEELFEKARKCPLFEGD